MGEQVVTPCQGGSTKPWYSDPAVVVKAFRYQGEVYLPQGRHPGGNPKICCIRISDGSHQDLDSREAGRLHATGKLESCRNPMEVLAWAAK